MTHKQGFRLGSAIVAAAVFGSVRADGEYHWIGEAEAALGEASNWQENAVPGVGDTMIFDPGANATNLIVNSGSVNVHDIRVLSGTVVITNDAGNLYLDIDTTNTVTVAEGAFFDVKNKIYPRQTGSKKAWLRKLGAGTMRTSRSSSASNPSTTAGYRVQELQLNEGTFEIATYRCSRYVLYTIESGATLRISNYSTISGFERFNVKTGGKFYHTGHSNALNMAGIYGGGDVYLTYSNGSPDLRPNLYEGPYRFYGRYLRSGTKGTWGYQNYCYNNSYPASAEAMHNPVCATNQYDLFAYYKAVIPLEFAAGVGEFYLPPLLSDEQLQVTTEDEAGEPIRLHANISANTTNGFEIVGRGDWFLRSGSQVLTGNQVRVTGTVGVPSGATLSFGDGENAANDFTEYPFALENAGTVYFQNAELQTVGSKYLATGKTYVTGATEFAGPYQSTSTTYIQAPVTFRCWNSEDGGSLSIDDASGGRLTLAGTSEWTTNAKSFANDQKLTLDGPRVSMHGAVEVGGNDRNFYHAMLPSPQGVSFQDGSEDSLLEVKNGARFHMGNISSRVAPNVKLSDGGRIILDKDQCWKGPETGIRTITLDGGVVEYCNRYQQYINPIFVNGANLRGKVTEKGASFENHEGKTGRFASSTGLEVNAPFESETENGAEDGGIRMDVGMPLFVSKPWNLTGPITLGDVRFEFGKSAIEASVDNQPVGTGDFVMDSGAWFSATDKAETLAARVAGGEGKKLIVKGAAMFDVTDHSHDVRTAPFTLTAGKAGSAESAFRCDGAGALTFWRGSSGAVCNNFCVRVEGGVDMYADGRTVAPVFAWAGGYADFMTYDSDFGFTNMTAYVRSSAPIRAVRWIPPTATTRSSRSSAPTTTPAAPAST